MRAFEKFQDDELGSPRRELMQPGFDPFQAAELIGAFLTQRGYGVSTDDARGAASRIESVNFALPSLQAELEKIAYIN